MQVKPAAAVVLLKHHSRDWRIALGLGLALVLAFMTYEQNPAILSANIAERIQSLDTGYSQPQSTATLLANAGRILKGKLLGFSARPTVERIAIDIKQLEFEKILADRKRALARNLLVEPVDIKAKIHYRGRRIKAKLRLKGDLPDHWISRYRMSFRVSLKGRNYILGFRKFSLHKPASRQHPYDQVYSDLVRRAGGLSPVHDYIHVYVNGEDWGIMNIEEHMSKELLEKQQVKDSLILKLGDEERDTLFYDRSREQDFYRYYRLSDPRLSLKVYDADKYLGDPLQRKWLSWIARQRLQVNNTTLYHIDSYSRALLLALIWNDGHPLRFSNSRHYFNPYLLQLEPIPSDSFSPFSIAHFGMFPRSIFDPLINNSIYPLVFTSAAWRQDLQDNFERVSTAVGAAAAITDHYQRYFPLDQKIDLAAQFQANLEQLRGPAAAALLPAAPAGAADPVLFASHATNGLLRFYNRVPGPVTITALQLDGRSISSQPVHIPAYDPYGRKPVVLNTALRGDLSGRLQLLARYQGRDYRIRVTDSVPPLAHVIPPPPNANAPLPAVTPAQAALLPAHLEIRHFQDGRLEIFNLLPEPVTLESIQVKGRVHLRPRLQIPGYRPGDYSPVILATDITGIQDGKLSATTRFRDLRRTRALGPTLFHQGLDNPLLAATPRNLPWLRASGGRDWRIPAGNWNIDQPVTIHGNVEIEAGTRLSFAPESFLIIKGALKALGSAAQPIVLQPRGRHWRGLYVLAGRQPSRLRHVRFKHTRALESGLLRLSGGVSFYATGVEMEHVSFEGSEAEDALNLIHSRFSLADIKVWDTASDGIDFDFSDGRIRDAVLDTIGGDALDFSGSKVRIDQLEARNINDKGVSAGELSSIAIADSRIVDAGIGLAAKDGSQITGRALSITGYAQKAAMSYVKKGFYTGAPQIHLENIEATPPASAYSRQRGTTLVVDGIDVTAEDIDVGKLYAQPGTAP